jgi:hypothetical protein
MMMASALFALIGSFWIDRFGGNVMGQRTATVSSM